MKKLFVFFLVLCATCAFADTATQQDQNRGPLDLASPTISVDTATPAMFLFADAFPASATVAAYEAANGVKLTLMPKNTRGFQITAFGGDMIFGGVDIATGSIYVGAKIASGSTLKWESRNPVYDYSSFRLLMNGASVGTATLLAW